MMWGEKWKEGTRHVYGPGEGGDCVFDDIDDAGMRASGGGMAKRDRVGAFVKEIGNIGQEREFISDGSVGECERD